jgi:ABC-type branched-chain amino acid transport systems, periplasmic component
VNAKGGIQGKKVEIVPLDNKTNPQESLIQAQKAIDAGCPLSHPGQRFVGAGALTDFVPNTTSAIPARKCCTSTTPRSIRSDQREVQLLAFPLGCELRHQDGGAHQLHEGRSDHQEALPDQSGLFVR